MSVAYPGRSGLEYLIGKFGNNFNFKYLVLFSSTFKTTVGGGLATEASFLSGEVLDLRFFSNSKIETICIDSGVNLPKYRITDTGQDPLVITPYNSFATMLVYSESDLDDAWITDFSGTYTAADEIQFLAPDTLSNFDFCVNPNRFYALGVTYTGSGVSSVPAGPGFNTITISGVNPQATIGTPITLRALGFTLLTLDERIGSVSPGSPETVDVSLISGRQNVTVF